MSGFKVSKVGSIDVYIPLRKYQLKPHLSRWCSAACTAAIIHRNPFFFVCTNRINRLNLKESSDRLVIVANRFLKLPNLHMLIKLSRNLALGTLGKLPIVFSRKANLLCLLNSTAHRRCLLHLIKQNSLIETLLRTLILLIQGISLPSFSFRMTLKLVKKVIMNLGIWS